MQRSTSPIRNNHPTVKPLALMRYLLRLITQPAHNHIIDPFAGSGTTGVAAALAGLECTLIELDPRHFDICCARVEWALRVRDRLGGVEPPLDLTPYTRPAAAAASGEAQLNLWGK
jgi:site-specific DNA-methyltransferase (adenine-specific)